MAKANITRRWLINNMGVIFVLLIIINFAAFYLVKSYYYSSVSQYLRSRSNMISSTLSRFFEDSGNYSTEIRNMVESFSEKEKMELMAINSSGDITITSSGFSPTDDADMPDYDAALTSPLKYGTYTGMLSNGEKIMAATSIVSIGGGDYIAMRLVVSLKQVDNQVNLIVIIVIAVSLLIILLLAFTGIYFIKSIVIPIRQIGSIARKLAAGDFSVRISGRSGDEIGELCEVINFMANELQNSEQIKNDFISSVSHELRTPLTAIKGWSETLTAVDDVDTIQKGMRVITGETERLSAIVEDLLDFSRIQNGRFTLEKNNIDILAELEEAILIYMDRAKRENVEIVYNNPEMLSAVYGDKNRLKQVFINVIDNAIKYCDDNDTVVIEATQDDKKIYITISDTGCGISEVDLPKIKTKFFKANKTRRGSGIGLAVADEIISMHDGILEIKSTLGEGTTVVITLPIVKKITIDEKESVSIREKTDEQERDSNSER